MKNNGVDGKMKYLCKKCNQYTEHEEINTVVKAGDSGTVKTTGYKCKDCGFVPLYLGKPQEELKIGS